MTQYQAELALLGVEALQDRWDDVQMDKSAAENEMAKVQQKESDILAELQRRIDFYGKIVNGHKPQLAAPKKK